MLSGDGLDGSGMEEAEDHAGSVSGSGAELAHLAECSICCVQSDGGRGLWLLALGCGLCCGTASEEEVCGEVFLTHADALPDEVVLISLQLLLQPGPLALVRIFCPVDPIGVRCS